MMRWLRVMTNRCLHNNSPSACGILWGYINTSYYYRGQSRSSRPGNHPTNHFGWDGATNPSLVGEKLAYCQYRCVPTQSEHKRESWRPEKEQIYLDYSFRVHAWNRQCRRTHNLHACRCKFLLYHARNKAKTSSDQNGPRSASHLRAWNFIKFPWGACPHTPLAELRTSTNAHTSRVKLTLLSMARPMQFWFRWACYRVQYRTCTIWVTSTIFWLSQLHACCACDIQTTRKATMQSHSESKCSLEAYPFVKLVSPFSFQKAYSISGEVGVSLILHICPWRSALVAWLW